ncbi:MAG TPA: hypothetical protein VG458_08835 [Solirubrobacterales bacterium]|nr:hypothetical protein [Solirubrobacterales bacterium]
MRRRPTTSDEQGSPIAIKLAWWAGFLATLVLVFALAQAKSAHAVALPPPVDSLVGALEEEAEDEREEEAEAEEGWEYEEECEVVGEGEQEEEVCEEVEGEDGTPPECLLNSADATVSAVPARDTLRLSVRYTSRSPAAVKVEYWLRGGKGPLRLGEDRKRFNRQGTFRSSERLSDPQMAKVVAARNFTVELQAVNTPRYCHRYFDQKRTMKRASGGGLTWSEPAARAAMRADG